MSGTGVHITGPKQLGEERKETIEDYLYETRTESTQRQLPESDLGAVVTAQTETSMAEVTTPKLSFAELAKRIADKKYDSKVFLKWKLRNSSSMNAVTGALDSVNRLLKQEKNIWNLADVMEAFTVLEGACDDYLSEHPAPRTDEGIARKDLVQKIKLHVIEERTLIEKNATEEQIGPYEDADREMLTKPRVQTLGREALYKSGTQGMTSSTKRYTAPDGEKYFFKTREKSPSKWNVRGGIVAEVVEQKIRDLTSLKDGNPLYANMSLEERKALEKEQNALLKTAEKLGFYLSSVQITGAVWSADDMLSFDGESEGLLSRYEELRQKKIKMLKQKKRRDELSEKEKKEYIELERYEREKELEKPIKDLEQQVEKCKQIIDSSTMTLGDCQEFFDKVAMPFGTRIWKDMIPRYEEMREWAKKSLAENEEKLPKLETALSEARVALSQNREYLALRRRKELKDTFSKTKEENEELRVLEEELRRIEQERAVTTSSDAEGEEEDIIEEEPLFKYIKVEDELTKEEGLYYDKIRELMSQKAVVGMVGIGKAKIPPESDMVLRNVATTVLAKHLGIGDMIMTSERVTLDIEGRQVQGVSMKEAEGTHAIWEQWPQELTGKPVQYTPNAVKQFMTLQVFDVLCGQIDRNPGNQIIRMHDGDGRRWVEGVTGIDNDLSFGLLSYQETIENDLNYLRPLEKDGKINLIGLDKAFAEQIMVLTPEALRFLLSPYLSEPEIMAASDRLKGIQQLLRRIKKEDEKKEEGKRVLISSDKGWESLRDRIRLGLPGPTGEPTLDYEDIAQRSYLDGMFMGVSAVPKRFIPGQ